jgi:hypothetical protein
MKNRSKLALAVATSVLSVATPVLAAAPIGVAGAFSGQYANTSGPGVHTNAWGLGGQLAFGLAPEFGAQIDAGYTNVNLGSGFSNSSLWNIGGHAFFAPAMGRLGGTLNYQSFSGGGAASFNIKHYGAFGEYYATDIVTIGGNAGGTSVGNCGGCSDGGYVSGGATFYAMPNLGLTGTIGYMNIGGIKNTTFGVSGEWLFSEEVPISGFIGYNNIDPSSGGGNYDQFLTGIKFYMTGNGFTLVEKHRNGALSPLVLNGLQQRF